MKANITTKKKILIVMLILSLFAAVFFIIESYLFTPKKWERSSSNERQRLITSLEDQYKIIGSSKEEIYALLGKPDADFETFFLYDLGEDNDLIYKILRMSFRGRHYEVYYIYFNDDGICVDKEIDGPLGG